MTCIGSEGVGIEAAGPDGRFGRSGDMLAFVDFEASSLAKDSYPVEVAWVFEDGACEGHLIRPAPGC